MKRHKKDYIIEGMVRVWAHVGGALWARVGGAYLDTYPVLIPTSTHGEKRRGNIAGSKRPLPTSKIWHDQIAAPSHDNSLSLQTGLAIACAETLNSSG